MKVGVFDSGIGGLSVANAIEQAFPELEVVFRNDTEHVPYGNKSPKVLLELVVPIFQELIDQDCQVIVVACNTVSTTLITQLRERFSVPFVAIEPMVKPAAKLTKTKTIAVCATPTTLASDRYQWLKDTYAKDITVIQPDCSTWSLMIEQKKVDQRLIKKQIDEALQASADIIVLGCTHYHWIEDKIQAMAAGKATVLQPEQAVVKQLWRVLARLS